MPQLNPSQNIEANKFENAAFNLSKYLKTEAQKDDQTLRRTPPGEQKQLAMDRCRESETAVEALAKNQFDNPIIEKVLQERLLESFHSLQANRARLQNQRNLPAYQQEIAYYQQQLNEYNAHCRQLTEFREYVKPKQKPQPATPPPPLVQTEGARPKIDMLSLLLNEPLLPKGDNQKPWASHNARVIERAMFDVFERLGTTPPFPAENIIQGWAFTPDHMPKDIKYTTPPLVWMEYRLEETVNGRLVSVYHAINSSQELQYILSVHAKRQPPTPLGAGIRVNMRRDVAEMLTPDNLHQHPGILLALAKDMARYFPPGTDKKLQNIKITI